jgi:hypothetical protein
VPVTATAYVDATAAAGVPYDYSVASVTAAGNSQNAPEAFGYRNVPAPTGVEASDDLPTQIRISWLPVNNPAVIGYRVYIRFPLLGFTSELGSVPATTTLYTVSGAGFFNNAEYAVQAVTLAGGSDASNWDVGSYGGSMMAMTASPPGGLPDGRIGGSVPDGANRVPTGKNGHVPIGNSLPTDASAGSGSTDIDRTVASERSCAEIVTRIEAMIAVSTDDDRSLDETVRAGLARLLIQDPNDPSLRIPACAMHEGDVNLDGSVDELDLAAFLAAWADWDLVQGDLDRDGTIDARDLDVIGRRLVRAAVGEEEPTSAE